MLFLRGKPKAGVLLLRKAESQLSQLVQQSPDHAEWRKICKAYAKRCANSAHPRQAQIQTQTPLTHRPTITPAVPPPNPHLYLSPAAVGRA